LVLEHGFLVRRSLPVHFVRGHVDKALDVVDFRALQEDVRPQNVVLREGEGVAEAVVHVGLGRKVHDRVNLFLFKYVVHEVRGTDVALDKLVVFVVLDFVQILQTGAVVQSVQVDLKWWKRQAAP